jgi:hypothetical protein
MKRCEAGKSFGGACLVEAGMPNRFKSAGKKTLLGRSVAGGHAKQIQSG